MRNVGGIHPLAVFKRKNVRLGLAVEDATVVGTGLHHQGESRKLSRPVVNLQAEQVLLQNRDRDVLGPVAHAPGRSL